MVAVALEEERFTGDRDTVLLLVSELVTNAVRHAATPFDVTIVIEGAQVTVAVVDHDRSHPPELQDPEPEDTSGRGLRIVQELSSSWGTESLGGNLKRVWFRLA
jgi:two-component sensor histidine kinase